IGKWWRLSRFLDQIGSREWECLVALKQDLISEASLHGLQRRYITAEIIYSRRPRAVENISAHASFVYANDVCFAGDRRQRSFAVFFLGWQRNVVGADYDHAGLKLARDFDRRGSRRQDR